MNRMSLHDLMGKFDMLTLLDVGELKDLLNDSIKSDDIIIENPMYRGLQQRKRELKEENRLLAEYSMSLEIPLREAQEKLHRSHLLSAERKKEFDRERLNYDSLAPVTSVDTLLAILQASAAQSEKESERLGEQFVAGFQSIEDFLEEFLRKRTEAHLRRIKVEKLTQFTATGSMTDRNCF